MKIVHVEDFVHPDAGYQLNSLAPLQVRQGHDVTIVTGVLDRMPGYLTDFFGRERMPERDARFTAETGVEIIRIPLLGFYSGRAIFSPSIIRRVSALKPDVVFVHGEDVDSDFVEKCLNIPLAYTDLLSFGTDTIHFSPNRKAGLELRKRHGIDLDSFLVLYAGKLDETKGGKLLAEVIGPSFPEVNGRKVEFLIIGTGSDAYGREVEAMLAQSANRVTRLPTLRFRDLADYYQAADLAVFPKQCSMSFFEIQSCGVPILFEDNEINRKRVVSRNAFIFQPGDPADLRNRIIELGSTDPALFEQYRQDARDFVLENYDYVPVAQKFTDVLSRAVASWQARGRRTFRAAAKVVDKAAV